MFENSPRKKNLEETVRKFRIVNVAEFYGQVGQESAMLTKFVENLNYDAQALIAKFGRHRISVANAWAYGRIDAKTKDRSDRKFQPANQRAIANMLYGGEFGQKNLGNVQPNDGWDFRGHGGIQLTGRAAHLAFSKYMGRPEIMLTPSLVADDPQLSTDAAGWFWTVYKPINGLTDVAAITTLVTGDPNHYLAERRALTRLAYSALQSK